MHNLVGNTLFYERKQGMELYFNQSKGVLIANYKLVSNFERLLVFPT